MLIGTDRYIACRYEYDALGNCTILYDPNNIGALNPFRWKGFYLDSETGLYYANGSYYDPETMLYVDAQDISSVVEKTYETRSLDRNGIPCDNILALAGNLSTASTSVALAPNPEYDPGQTWWEKVSFKISSWWRGISPIIKVSIGIALIAISIVIACFTGGASVGVGAAAAAAAETALIELAVGIGFATVGWIISSAISGHWDINGLGDAVADAIFFTGVFMFISTSINAVKCLARTENVPTLGGGELKGYELDPRSIAYAKEGNPDWSTFRKRVWQKEAELRPEFYKGNIDRMLNGKAPIVNGKSMQLHHVVGKSVNLYDVIQVTPAQHTTIHKAIGYHVNKPKLPWTLENAIKYGGLR